MALLNNLVNTDNILRIQTSVSADYCYNNLVFQIRTYKNGDIQRSDTAKQNIQIDKAKAIELVKLLNEFINQ